MSLNGLDASAVNEAHHSALTESGGWFLLKYVNRDTVELLSRGAGGVGEAKTAVEQYEEKSPLYGLVQYRRKRVVLKYVPEGTSRLLQVRLTVQFQSVLDALPHDAVFSFTTPSELADSALGLSTVMQPTTHSGTLTPSNSSGRNHRLNDIREDGEEAASSAHAHTDSITISPAKSRDPVTPRPPPTNDLGGLPASAIRAKAMLARRKEEDRIALEAAAPAPAPAPAATPPVESVAAPPKPTSTQIDSTDRSPRKQSPINPAASIITRNLDKPLATTHQQRSASARQDYTLEQTPSPSLPTPTNTTLQPEQSPIELPHSRHLSENETVSISQWNEQVAAYTGTTSIKPKKKLAPRPHVDSSARPKTPNSVAILPPTVRASSRIGGNISERPTSRGSTKSVPTRFVPPNDVPPLPVPFAPLYKSAESRRAPSIASSGVTDNPAATPEKLRLMKALQNRKRNMLLAQRAASAQSSRLQADSKLDHHVRNVSEAMYSPLTRPATPKTINNPVTRVSAEHQSDKNSTTASPTSAATAMTEPSTKPSSFSGEIETKASETNLSVDTHSSATPRAVTEVGEPVAVQAEDSEAKGTKAFDEVPAEQIITPDVPLVEEAPIRLTKSKTPPVPDAIVEQVPPQKMPEPQRLMVKQRKSSSKMNKALHSIELAPMSSARSDASSRSRSRTRRARGPNSPRMPRSGEYSMGSDDESFMEELRNATVQEAKPMSVARSQKPTTVRKLSSDRIREMTRMPTMEPPKSVKSGTSEPDKSHAGSVRSASAAMLHWPPTQDPVPLTNKPSLSHGISKRIKALEVLTNRDSMQSSPPSPRDASFNRDAFTNLLTRASFIGQPAKPDAPEDATPNQKVSVLKPSAGPPVKRETGPQPLVQRQGEAAEVFVPQHKGETISVTARIVRDQHRHTPAHSSNFHEQSVNMHRSPLIVEHERQRSEPPRPLISQELSRMSLDPPKSAGSDRRRFSLSSYKSASTVRQAQTDGRGSKLSLMGRERRRGKADSETSSITEEKQASRTSRFVKRISGIGSRLGPMSRSALSSRDGLASSIIMEQAEKTTRRDSTSESMLGVIDIGDVNVQFPESLLWKRRYLRIDDQGNLLFSPPTDNAHIRLSNRKFHLADIKAPYLPSREREEMAWSICIDLHDNTRIQCACESKKAQRQILKMLLDAHDAYNSLYKQ